MAGCGEHPQTVAVIHREEHESLGLVLSCMQGKTVGKKHLIPHYKLSGKTIFFNRQEIIDWVNSRPARRRGMQQENMNANVSDETLCNDMEALNVGGMNINSDMP